MSLIGSFIDIFLRNSNSSICSPEAEAGWSILCARVSEV